MKPIHIRFGSTLGAALARIRERHDLFQRLLVDRPAGPRVTSRTKQPEHDLKASYMHRLKISAFGTLSAAIFVLVLYPEDILTVSARPPGPPTDIQVEYIPETVQRRRPPAPPRPAVPLAVEGDIVPEDVTIESTELDLDSIPVDLRLATAPGALGPPTDDPMLDTEIEFKPHPIRIVTPRYPAEAERKKLEGEVVLRVLVDKRGRVEQAEVLNGPQIFREAALVAARQFRFRPGKHEGERRKVWMRMPITFKLN